MESWVNAGSKRSRPSKRPWIDDPERMTELLELLGDAAGHPKSESEVIQLAAAVS
jgi:hypothetical protein